MATVDGIQRILDTGRRLVVKDMDVENFKSYAGRHRVGPFHKTFTAVIGPNGSGKSNVIDAMLFVFGKKAKKIRLEKLSELIHNSAAHPNLAFASVAVNFVEIEDDPADNTQWKEVPHSGFTVTREVQSNNQSQYYVNRKKFTQKEVIQFLIKHGIDLEHNRFLILQGEVEQIAMMKPKAEKEGEEGLLEYFDDLIGTNRYIEPIDAAVEKAEKCQEERLAALDQKEKLRKERAALEGAKAQTLEYVSKQNHQLRLVSVLCQKKIAEVELKLVEPRKELAELHEQLAAIEKEIAALDAKLYEIEKTDKEAKKKIAKATKDLELLTKKKTEKEDRLAEIDAEAKALEKLKKKEADKLKKAQEEVRKMEAHGNDATTDIRLAEKNLTEAQEVLDTDEPKKEELLDQLQKQVAPLDLQLSKLRREAAPVIEAAAAAEQKEKLARVALEDQAREGEELQARAARVKSEMQKTAEQLREVGVEVHKIETEETPTEDDMREVEKEKEEARVKKMSVNAQIQQVKVQLREDEAGDSVFQFLISCKELKGYHGTLRQLGRIDKKFDIAAGVAGAANWGFHVVDNGDVATQALKLLKTNNMRATFLPLEKFAQTYGERMDTKSQAPEGCPRLYDLITCDNKFRPAFYHAVRDTLVASDITQARRVGLGGKQRYRVVTSRGELVEQSGAITGGGRDLPQGAKLDATHAPADKKRAREQLNVLQRELQEAADREQQLGVQLSALTGRILSAKNRAHALARLKARKRDIESTIEAQEAQLERLDAQIQTSGANAGKQRELMAAIDVAVAASNAARKECAQATRQIDEIERQKKSIGGPELARLTESVDSAKQRIRDNQKKLDESKKLAQKCKVTKERRMKEVEELQHKQALDEEAAHEERMKERAKVREEVELLVTKMKKSKADLDEAKEVESEAKEQKKRVSNEKEAATDSKSDISKDVASKEETMKKELAEIEKFNAKIDEGEVSIRTNVTDFGIRTWREKLHQQEDDGEPDAEDEDASAPAASDDEESASEAESQGEEQSADDDNDDDSEEDSDSDDDSDASPRGRKKAKKGASAKKGKKTAKKPRMSKKEERALQKAREKKEKKLLEKRRKAEAEDKKRAAEAKRKAKRDRRGEQQVDYAQSSSDEDEEEEEDEDIDVSKLTTRLTPEQLSNYTFNDAKQMAHDLTKELGALTEDIDMKAVSRWREKDIAYRAQKKQYDAVRHNVAELEAAVEVLKEERKEKFMEVFDEIQKRLKQMYQLLAAGGDAEIELLDTADPFEGINFVVRPPRKSWKPIMYLSGGEKTLSSLALVFALHHVKPTPIYVMDEIDAALDFRNVSIVARYVLEAAVGAQFIIISLRNNMFELAHQLIGICKVRDCTKSIVLNPGSVAQHIVTKGSSQQVKRSARERDAAGAPARPPASGVTNGGRSPRMSQNDPPSLPPPSAAVLAAASALNGGTPSTPAAPAPAARLSTGSLHNGTPASQRDLSQRESNGERLSQRPSSSSLAADPAIASGERAGRTSGRLSGGMDSQRPSNSQLAAVDEAPQPDGAILYEDARDMPQQAHREADPVAPPAPTAAAPVEVKEERISGRRSAGGRPSASALLYQPVPSEEPRASRGPVKEE